MLDPIYFTEKLDEFKKRISIRNFDVSLLDGVAKLSEERKKIIQKVETLKAKRNQVSQEIGMLKAQAKKDPEKEKEANAKVDAMRAVGDEIKSIEEQLAQVEEKINAVAFGIPNLPHESVPAGKDESENKEVRKWGTPAEQKFKPKDHVDLAEKLGILDFETAAKLSGARFAIYQGAGAALERALTQFMLDLHTKEHGYKEVIPPYLVNRETMTGTGQLPKFEEDLFKTGTSERELFLIPTAEVPLTNIPAGKILDKAELPLYYTAHTPCFRSEAGSYGKDTRGLFRQHQFQKVELVKITDEESSYEELEKLVSNAEKVLQLLELPYRVVTLCSGDMGFSAAKTYDIEVWLPSQKRYREISSCSNCEGFQARRAQIRYRPEAKAKPKIAHTLNGSGLAVGRTFIAVLENHQQEDGSILIPSILNRYLENSPGFENKGDQLYLRG